VKKRSGECL
jgi:hypothetical protein